MSNRLLRNQRFPLRRRPSVSPPVCRSSGSGAENPLGSGDTHDGANPMHRKATPHFAPDEDARRAVHSGAGLHGRSSYCRNRRQPRRGDHQLACRSHRRPNDHPRIKLPGLCASIRISNPVTRSRITRSTSHQVEQALQVFPVGVLNHDPTLPTTGIYPYLGIEPVAESLFDLQNPCIPCQYRI